MDIKWANTIAIENIYWLLMTKFKEITHAEFIKLRKEQWLAQDKFCPILRQQIAYEDAVFDHKHKNKSEPVGEDGKGLLRGVLHFQANSWEGKCANSFKRYGMHKLGISLSEALRNLADYIDNPPLREKIVHPNERPKAKKLLKRDYKRICKYYFEMFPTRRKLPVYPKSGKMNKEFRYMLEWANYLHSLVRGTGTKPPKGIIKSKGK